ncbi:MAG: hypothetical protein Q7S41_04130 [Candidatus Limnocylindria bacterium]|nr:hypothetical protein [Candidatus Limnocylindria bacterium]
MPVRKIAKIVGAAMRDADRARKASTDPKWRKAQQQDRRGTLRKFETVEHALQDREKRARSGAAKSKAKKK